MSRALATVVALLAVFGAWLRVDRIRTQVPFHDERHTLATAFHEPASRIVSSFGAADHSAPAALWAHALAALDALDERGFWAPSLFAGIVGPLLLVGPVSRRLSPPVAWVATALVAICPILVYFSRTARPYLASTLCAVAASVLLVPAASSQRRTPRVVLAAASAAVVWSMPIHSPFVLAAATTRRLSRRLDPSPDRLDDFRAALAGLGLGALLSLPALLGDLATLLGKARSLSPSAHDLLAAGHLALGFGIPGVALAILALAILGARRVRDERARETVRVLAVAAAVQVGAIALLAPAGGAGSPFVLARYLLPSALAVMILAALGGVELATTPRSGPIACSAVLSALAVACWLPFHDQLAVRTDSFRSTRLYQRLFRTPREIAHAFRSLPEPYAPLLPATGPGAVLEAPYDGVLRVPYPYYQTLHGREVFLGVGRGACASGPRNVLPVDGEGGFHLSRLLTLDAPDGLTGRSIRFVVLHRDPESEVPWLRSPRRPPRFDFDACVAHLTSRTGREPVVSGGIAVFDLTSANPSRADPGRRGRD